MALTQKAHQAIKQHLADCNITPRLAIDATCGNGHDTLFLCQMGFAEVIAFDIQQTAIDATVARLEKQGFDARMLLGDHASLTQYINQPIDVVMFNLGFLPNSDKKIATLKQSTLIALNSALSLLNPNGLITILCYPGHSVGQLETKGVQNWLSTLADNWRINATLSDKPTNQTPVLYRVSQRNYSSFEFM